MFHKHDWKEIARTFAPPRDFFDGEGVPSDFAKLMAFGMTTILWECQDKDCQKLRKEEMLGEISINKNK